MTNEQSRASMLKTLDGLRQHMTTDPAGPGVRVTPALELAVNEACQALAKPRTDWQLVAALLRVKSFIAGAILGSDPYGEDALHNQQLLPDGSSVYGMLDCLHHKAAGIAGTVPAGCAILIATRDGGVSLATTYELPADSMTRVHLQRAEAVCSERAALWAQERAAEQK